MTNYLKSLSLKELEEDKKDTMEKINAKFDAYINTQIMKYKALKIDGNGRFVHDWDQIAYERRLKELQSQIDEWGERIAMVNYLIKRKKEFEMNDPKEVFFNEYCESCHYRDLDEANSPCNECLDNPANIDSHKPVYFKEET